MRQSCTVVFDIENRCYHEVELHCSIRHGEQVSCIVVSDTDNRCYHEAELHCSARHRKQVLP